MQRPVAVWISLRGRTLTQFPTIPYNLQMANWSDSISQTGQCKTKTADCGPGVKCRLSVKSAVLIAFCTQPAFYSQSVVSSLHSLCVLHPTVSQTLPESNWTHTDPVYLTFTWENLKFQLKKIKWFASIRLRSFLKKGLWFEATQFFYSF